MVAVLTGLVCLVMTALLMSLTDVMHAGQDPLLLTFLGGGTVALGLVLRSALISGLLFALSVRGVLRASAGRRPRRGSGRRGSWARGRPVPCR